MDSPAPPATMTISAAAASLSISVSTLRRWTHEGVIPSSFFGGRYHYRAEDLAAFVEDNMAEAA